MDLLSAPAATPSSAMTPTPVLTEQQLSLSAQPSPSASLPVLDNQLAMSAPSTPTDASSSLIAGLTAGSSTAVPDEKEERPSLSYKDLIIEAIESSTDKRLKLSEIYHVIRYLHPYYRKRSDQWGWQNSIRHNLSLHDCFVKLPLKQTSASGVVGHYWTVVRDLDDKQSSSRRRNRSSKLSRAASSTRVNSANASASTTTKVKDRQSVSSDSGVMSDESQASSPSTLLMESPRKESVHGTAHLVALAQQLAAQQVAAASAFMPPTVDNSLLNRLTLTALMDSAGVPAPTPVSVPSSVGTGVLENPLVNELQRLQLLSLLQQQSSVQNPLLVEQSTPTSTTNLLTQLLLFNKLKDVQQPPQTSTLDLLSLLQPPPAQPTTPQVDVLRLLQTIMSSYAPATPTSTPSTASLSSLMEQHLASSYASGSSTTPPAASTDNLCVI